MDYTFDEKRIASDSQTDAHDPDGDTRPHARRMDPATEAEKVLRLYSGNGSNCLRFHNGDFLLWSAGCYKPLTNDEIRARVVRAISSSWSGVGSAHVTNILEHLRSQAFLRRSIESPVWLEKPLLDFPADECLATKDEVIHLPSLALQKENYSLPATPAFFTFNSCEFSLNVNSPPPQKWLGFLNSLWADDPQSIDTLQEIFGYLLTADTRQQKIFMLVGPKRSGKGTIARILRELVGKINVAAPTLSSLATNFGLSPLIGKSVGIISDARLSGRADQAVVVERLLSISGEDAQTIDRKHKSAVTMKLPTRFVILSNELPRLHDASGAVVSRFIMLNTTQSFYGRENQNLTDELLEALPGILLWAIGGWHRLHERGHFVQPDSALESLSEMNDLGSPVGAFVGQCCVVGPSEVVVVKDLFDAWDRWCGEQGREKYVGTVQSFGRDLFAAEPSIKRKKLRTGESRTRAYQGIGLH